MSQIKILLSEVSEWCDPDDGESFSPNICTADKELIEQALREKLARDNPKPLTLDRLKERDGMPVWVSGKTMFGNQYAEWKVVSLHTGRDDAISFESGPDLLEKNYGKTWIAYDYPPKESI